jgi:hypothetical protein
MPSSEALTASLVRRHVPQLATVPLVGDDGLSSHANLGVLVSEEWAANPLESTDSGRGARRVGSHRAYLATDPRGIVGSAMLPWSDISFRKLRLLGQQLSFTVDFSKVGCGCNGPRRLHSGRTRERTHAVAI